MFLILFLSQIRELKKSQDGDKMGEGMSFPSQHLTVCCWHVCMWVRDAKCWRQKSDVFISKMTHWACAANVLAVTSHQRDFRRKKKSLHERELNSRENPISLFLRRSEFLNRRMIPAGTHNRCETGWQWYRDTERPWSSHSSRGNYHPEHTKVVHYLGTTSHSSDCWRGT